MLQETLYVMFKHLLEHQDASKHPVVFLSMSPVICSGSNCKHILETGVGHFVDALSH